MVAEGTYNESVGLPSGVGIYGGFVGRETLLSQRDWNAHVTRINGVGTAAVTIDSCASPTAVDGFLITGGTDSVGNGIDCYDSGVTIMHNVISGNLWDCIDCEV